jgi:4,4'-diaponeurosporenoate glycosyltransferase
VILPAVVFLLLLAGFAVFRRLPYCVDGDVPAGLPALSVIVPARNEEGRVGRLVESLQGQKEPPAEVLVVDDGSTDATAAEAAEAGARVVASGPLPSGWRGKTWACHRGAQAAAGGLLLFVDADVWFEAGGLRRLLATWARRRGALSVVPFHRTRRLYEGLSAFFNLAMIIGVGAFTVLGRRMRPSGMFGQLLLIDRASYDVSGGHRAVRSRILENMHLARRLNRMDIPVECRGGAGTASMRMYPGGLRDLFEGWSKAFVSGAASVPAAVMVPTVAWMTGLMAAFGMLLLSSAAAEPLWPAVYAAAALQVGLLLRRAGRFHPLSWLAYPLPLLFFFGLQALAGLRRVRGGPVSWKGRSIPAAGEGGDAR